MRSVQPVGSSSNLDAQATASLQARLANCPPQQRAELVSSLMPLVDDMCSSERGPYVLQAMIAASASTPFLTQQLAERLAPRFVALALHAHGFYVARALIFGLDAEWPLTRSLTRDRLLPAAAQLALSPTGVRVLYYAHVRGMFAQAGALGELIGALQPHVCEVGREKHGARLLRKLLAEASGEGEISALIGALIPHAASLVADEHGAAVMRALLDSAASTEESCASFLAALQPQAVRLSTDPIAHTALQACLLAAGSGGAAERERRALAELVVAQADRLATHPFGSCVLQAALLHDVPARAGVIARLVERADELARDRFGNHVLQHAIARAGSEAKRRACELLAAECVSLAHHTHASFALQGALRTCSREESAPLERALSAAATDLARDRISSMVLQQLLRCLGEGERERLIDTHLLPCVGELMGNDHAVFVLHECAAVSPRVAAAMRAELCRVERLIDEFASSERSTLALPLTLSAFQRKRAHLYVRSRFGAALVSMSIGESDAARTLHIFKAEGTRVTPQQQPPRGVADSSDSERESFSATDLEPLFR